jgi:hypothetical protein
MKMKGNLVHEELSSSIIGAAMTVDFTDNTDIRIESCCLLSV